MAKIKIADLVLDFNLYPRNDVSSVNVTSLIDSIEMGDPIPPPIVDKDSKRVVDGFHRVNAYKRLGQEEIEVTFRSYKNEQEMFADAVRLNRAHGRAFDPYDIRRSVQKLAEFGLRLDAISDIIRVPKARIEQFTGEFAKGPRGADVVVKRGLISELRGRTLNKAQVKANESYSGYQPAYHVNQLMKILEAGIIPKSENFHVGMDNLCGLWASIRKKKSA